MTTNYADVVPLPDQKHNLVLGQDAGGHRFYLDDRPVHAGTALELLVGPDTWMLGRFETVWTTAGGVLPIFCIVLPSRPGWFEGCAADIRLPPSACLRWP